MNRFTMRTSLSTLLLGLGVLMATLLIIPQHSQAADGGQIYVNPPNLANLIINVNPDGNYVAAPDAGITAQQAVSGAYGATYCQNGYCQTNLTNEQATAQVNYYLSLVVAEYGSVAAGAQVVVRDAEGRITYLACNNGGSITVTYIAPPPPPTVSLTPSNQTIPAGGSGNLHWSSTDATTCTSSDFVTNGATSGDVSISPLSSGSYSITCTGGGGSANAVASFVVSAAPPTQPVASLSANPTLVNYNSTSSLTYKCTNSVSGTISGIGSIIADGAPHTVSSLVVTSPQQYTLTCTASGGVTDTATVSLTTSYPAPTAVISVSPTSITSGNTSQLTYTCTNSNSYSVDNNVTGGNIPIAPAYTSSYTNSVTVYPPSTATYTINCVGLDNISTAVAQTTLTVAGLPDLTPLGAITPTWVSTPGQTFNFSLTAQNIGGSATPAPNGYNIFEFDDNSDHAVVNDPSRPGNPNPPVVIPVGGTNTIIAQKSFPYGGNWFMRACVDAMAVDSSGNPVLGQITESDETNNCTNWQPIRVAVPDIKGTGPASPNAATTNQQQTFSDVVTNAGDADMSGVQVVMQILNAAGSSVIASVNASPSGTATAYTMNAGTSQNVSGLYTFTSPGTYTVRFCGNMNTSGNFADPYSEGDYTNNCGQPQTVTVSNLPTPVATLTASPNPINYGDSSTLTYSCTNSSTAAIDQGVLSTSATLSGTPVVTPSSTTTYTLTCTNSQGTAVTQSVTVTVVPEPDIRGDAAPTPSTANTGISQTFSGTVTNIGNASGVNFPNVIDVANSSFVHLAYATTSPASMTLAGGTTTAGVTGSYTFGSPGTYQVRICGNMNTNGTIMITEKSGGYGNNCGAWQTVTVSTIPSPTGTFSASPISINYGANSTLTYTCANSSNAAINQGVLATTTTLSGAPVVTPNTTTTYTLTCTNSVGATATYTATVAVTALPDVTATTTPTGSTSFNVATPQTFNGTVANIGTAAGSNVPNVLKILNASGTSALAYIAASPATVNIPTGGSPVAVSGSWTATTTGTFLVEFCGNMNTSGVNVITEKSGGYGNNCSNPLTVTVSSVPAPTGTFSASPTSINYGANSTLTYTCANSSNAAINQGVLATTTTLSGAPVVTPNTTTTYTLTCTNSVGATATYTATVAVTALPDVTATTTPTGSTSFNVATPQTFNGIVGNIGTAAATGEPNVMKVLNASGTSVISYILASPATSNIPVGSQVAVSGVFTATTTGTYQIQFCGNQNTSGVNVITEKSGGYGNNCTSPLTVTVSSVPAPTGTFSATPTSISYGDTSTLTYSCSNSMNAYINNGVLATTTTLSGAPVVTPNTSTTYTLTCTNSVGATATYTATVTVTALPDFTATTTPSGSTSILVGAGQTYAGTVGNIGTASGTNVPNVIKILNAAGTSVLGYGVASPSTNTIGANGGQLNVNAVFTATTTGTFLIEFCANQNTSGVAIQTEKTGGYGNNCSGPLTVTASNSTAFADIRGDSAPAQTSATVNVSQNFTGTVTNIGGGTGTNFTNVLQILDSTGTTNIARVLATPNPMTLAGGTTTAAVSGSYTFTSVGTYTVRFCGNMDTSGAFGISEGAPGFTSNNCGALQTVVVSNSGSGSIASCTPSPSTAATGTPVTWTVATTSATFVPAQTTQTWSVSGGSPASQNGTPATFTSSFLVGGDYSPTVTATNGSQTSAPFSCTPVHITGNANTCSSSPSPVITSSQTRVISGSSVVLRWSATGVAANTTCTVTGANVGGSGVNTTVTTAADNLCDITNSSNSVTIPSVTTQQVYSITCSGVTNQVIVNVLPKINEF